MKFISSLFVLFLLFNCSKNTKEENKLLINKNNFSVSEFDRKLDSLNNFYTKNDSIPPIIKYDKRLNKSYMNGAIHFLILDKNNSYYVINYLKPFILMCGNTPILSKQDSINFVKESNQLTDKIKPIKTSEIIKILQQNQKAIVNSENQNPLNISFALKNDTLKGSIMYNIIRFMENNKMKLYTIRIMNEYELVKTNK